MKISGEEGSIQHPFSTNTSKLPEAKDVSATREEKKQSLGAFAFPKQTVEPIKEESRNTKPLSPDDSLLAELKQILNLSASQIEQEILSLEKGKKNSDLLSAIVEAESWGGWMIETTGSTSESMKQGVEFLERVVPHQLLAKLPKEMPLEKITNLTTLGGAYLTALESGFEGLSIIFKINILQKSEEILAQLKSTQSKEAALQDKEAVASFEKRKQQIKEWEINIKLQKEEISEEKIQFGLSSLTNFLYLSSLSLSYFPTSQFAKYTKTASVGVTWMMSGLEIVSLAWNLKKSSKDTALFNQWKESFLKWKKESQVKGGQNGSYASSSSSLTQRQMQAVDVLGKSSGNLLEKREAILKKKILLLKPQFQTIQDDIRKLKEGAFIRDMQQILWSHLQKSDGSAQEIKQILETWGFYRSKETSPHTEQLLKLLEDFVQEEIEEKSSDGLIKEKQKAFTQAFHDWMSHPTALSEQYQSWYRLEVSDNLDELLAFYVDHQETIELTTKNALKDMVEKKHNLEERFIAFKNKTSWISFGVSAITLTITAALAIAALLTLPIGGAGFILLCLTYGSSVISLGIWGAAYAQARREKPNTTRLLSLHYQAKMMWARLRTSISTYFLQAKEKKLLEVSNILYQLHLTLQAKDTNEIYQKALKDYKQAKIEFDESKKKTDEWTAHLDRLETAVKEKTWEDFAAQADLKINKDSLSFDTLRAFQEAFRACNLNLLSEETRKLLTAQLGIDMKSLQNELQKEPKAIQNALQEFFTLDDAALISFIKKQELSMQQSQERLYTQTTT